MRFCIIFLHIFVILVSFPVIFQNFIPKSWQNSIFSFQCACFNSTLSHRYFQPAFLSKICDKAEMSKIVEAVLIQCEWLSCKNWRGPALLSLGGATVHSGHKCLPSLNRVQTKKRKHRKFPPFFPLVHLHFMFWKLWNWDCFQSLFLEALIL